MLRFPTRLNFSNALEGCHKNFKRVKPSERVEKINGEITKFCFRMRWNLSTHIISTLLLFIIVTFKYFRFFRTHNLRLNESLVFFYYKFYSLFRYVPQVVRCFAFCRKCFGSLVPEYFILEFYLFLGNYYPGARGLIKIFIYFIILLLQTTKRVTDSHSVWVREKKYASYRFTRSKFSLLFCRLFIY